MAALAEKLSGITKLSPADAGQACRSIIESAANDVDDKSTFGVFLLEVGQFDRALALVEEMLKHNRNDAFAWSLRGAVFAASGKTNEALSACRKGAGLSNDADIQARLARVLAINGEVAEADKICRKILKNSPEHIPAMLAMAQAMFRTGKAADAKWVLDNIIKSAPDAADAYAMRGSFNMLTRNFQAALNDAAAAIKIKPWLIEAHVMMANLLRLQGKINETIEYIKNLAVFAAPVRESDMLLAACYSETGHHAEAEQIIRKWLKVFPDDAMPHDALGMTCFNQGRYDEAIAEFNTAIRLNQKNQDYWLHLASSYIVMAKNDHALKALQQAEAINPSRAVLHALKSDLYQTTNNGEEALKSVWMAVRLVPDDVAMWQKFAGVIQNFEFTSANPAIEEDLVKCLSLVTTDKSRIAKPVLGYIANSPGMAELVEIAMKRDVAGMADKIENSNAIDVLANRLMILLLENTLIPAVIFEMLITTARAALVSIFAAGRKIENPRLLPFLHAVARQCFMNEYACYVEADEAEAIARIKSTIAAAGNDAPEHLLVALLCYHSMNEMPELADLWNGLAETGSDRVKELVRTEWQDILEEKKIQAAIKPITAIDDGVSKAVQSQYEQNPYPRWVDMPRTLTCDVKAAMVNSFPQLRLEQDEWNFPENPEILIAGCGTGRHPISVALQYIRAKILAVDLSSASLSYAIRKEKNYNVPNLEFAQADILALPALGRKFDMIESVGVIHHMRDPFAGWQALYDMLNPGGILRLGLYSEAARGHVVACRNFIAESGYQPTVDGIRECRRKIIALPADRLERSIATSRDFYSISNCRDLIFHVQEHRFTIPQIKAGIEKLGLEFLGFSFEDSYFLRQNYLPLYPDDPNGLSFDNWQEFEQKFPTTFAGMYNFCMRKPS